MTIAQLIAEVKGNAGRTDKDSVIVNALNWAMKRICSDYDLPEFDTQSTTTTVVGQDYIAAPADLRVLWNAWCDGKLMAEVSLRQLADLYPNRTTVVQARPFYIVQSGRTAVGEPASKVFKLWPVPDGVYEIKVDYSRWPRTYTSSDVSLTPELVGRDDVLIAAATAELFAHLQQHDQAAVWLSTYRRLANIYWSAERRHPLMQTANRASRYVSTNPQADPLVRRWV